MNDQTVNPSKVKIVKVKKLKLTRYKCSKCFCSFPKRYMLISHLQYFHEKIRPNNTGVNKKRINTMKSFKCSACKRIFQSSIEWKAHKRCSKEHEIFQCIECNVKLKSSLMSDHLARVHGVSINDHSEPNKVKTVSSRSNWTCLICNTTFKLKKQLIEHEKNKHQVSQQNTYSYQCKVCEKSFRRPYLLREHEQVHEKRILFRCAQCPAKYSSSSNLRRHVKSKHELSNAEKSTGKNNATVALQPNPKPTMKYICELCGKVLKSRYSWSCHKQRHTGKRPFQCKLCDAKFFEGANLRRHAKQKHKLDKIRITDLDRNVEDSISQPYNENLFSNI